MTLLLDTHVLLWWLQDSPELGAARVQTLERSEAGGEPLGVASISLWEIAKLNERGRIDLQQPVEDVVGAIEASARFRVLPLSGRVAIESTRLGPRFHRDPVDQILVATARVHGLRLVTADRRIRRSRLVSVV